MPGDLSAYLSNALTLNYRTNKLVLHDNSNYPAGVNTGIVGIISITQPDGNTRTGNWTTPDVTYFGSSLQDASIDLRLQADGSPQQGNYTVVYQVDHPFYTPTTLTRTFVLSYKGATPIISELFDVFTPSLKVQDTADYSKGGFNAPTIARLWSARVGTVATLAGSSSILDLVYSANYYDAAYTISITTDLTYQHSTYGYLSVVDRRTATLSTTANTPPSYTTLKTYLKAIKDNFDSLQTCDTTSARNDFEYAAGLLGYIKSRICAGGTDLINLYSQIRDFLNVYHNYITVVYVNTNAPIPAYSYADVDCGTGSGGGNDLRITNSDIAHWNTAYAAIPLDDLEYLVGVTSGAPTAGTNTFSPATNAFVNRRIRLAINKIPIYQIDNGTDPYFSKPLISNTVTLARANWETSDIIKFEFY